MKRLALTSTATAAIIAGTILQAQDTGKPAVPAKLLRDLASGERPVRIAAAKALDREESLPESAIDPIVTYLKSEVRQAVVPDPGATHDIARPSGPISTSPEDLSLARIKAKPSDYIDGSFYLIGIIKVSDYYNFGHAKAASTHYSFRLSLVGGDGNTVSGSVPIYALRFRGAALAEQVTRAEERGIPLVVRLKCTIPQAYCKRPDEATESIEATDWQFLEADGKSWRPSAYGGIRLAGRLLYKTGKPSVPKVLDLIMEEQRFYDERADLMLRANAVSYLLELPKADRGLAMKWLPQRARRTKSARAKLWAARTYKSLAKGDLDL